MQSATRLALLGVVVAGLTACGGGGGGGGGGGAANCTPTSSSSIRITSAGTTPKNACVLPGGSVSFINDDTAAHNIAFESPCTGLTTGDIPPNASAAVSFATTGNCRYHDSADPTNTKLQGLVAVASGTVGGGGY